MNFNVEILNSSSTVNTREIEHSSFSALQEYMIQKVWHRSASVILEPPESSYERHKGSQALH